MFSFTFFTAPETHADAAPMAQYYDDLAEAVTTVRAMVTNADEDPGFKKAAEAIGRLVLQCRDIETVSALEVQGIDNQRKELLKGLGTNRAIDVTGEASKLLATKYMELLQALYDKQYWPAETCPSVLGQSYLKAYANGFNDAMPRLQEKIDLHQTRISDYDESKKLKRAV